MKLFEAIIDANARAGDGARSTGVQTADFPDALPLAALTCIDARLNSLIPDVFGVSADKFVWLRNAGNIITGPLSSTVRSLALACAVKGAREIAIVGHSDCQVAKTNALELTTRFEKLGVSRQQLPDNLNEFFGLFASERQNVLKAVDIVRQSPLIGPNLPVHGLLLDITSGRLEWLANGYEQPARTTPSRTPAAEAVAGFATNWQPIGSFETFNQSEISPVSDAIGAHQSPQREPLHPPEPAAQPTGSSTATTSLLDKAGQWMSEVKLLEAQTVRETVAQAGRAAVATVRELAELIDRDKKYRVIGSDMKEYGPIAGFKLVQWLMEDRITPDSPVRLDGTGTWQPLKNLVQGAIGKHVPFPPPLEGLANRAVNTLKRKK